MALISMVVIPARLKSTRLPGKMLLADTGKPLIQHTYEAACRALLPSRIVIATDSIAIAGVVASFGGAAMLTDPDATCGSERVAEVAAAFPHVDAFVNLQGDEPEMTGSAIDYLIDLLERNWLVAIATLAAPIRRQHSLFDPACVKVVFDNAGRAMYFSRLPIPYSRRYGFGHITDEMLAADPPRWHQHLGIYAYRRDALMAMSHLPVAIAEEVEGLEQLRFLDAGMAIRVGVIQTATRGIDTRAEYDAFVSRHGGAS